MSENPGYWRPKPKPETGDLMKPTLLIVDDEKTTREGLRAALEERYDVYIAEDAKAAMNLLEGEHFDVMLTDFQLPNEDGMKLIGRAKSPGWITSSRSFSGPSGPRHRS